MVTDSITPYILKLLHLDGVEEDSMKVDRQLGHLSGEGGASHLMVVLNIRDEGFQRPPQMALIEYLQANSELIKEFV